MYISITFIIFIFLIALAAILEIQHKHHISNKYSINKETSKEFDDFYNKLSELDLKKISSLQKKLSIYQTMIILGILLPLSIFMIFANKVLDSSFQTFVDIIIILSFSSIIISFINYLPTKKKYKKAYKEEIISNLVKVVNKNLSYSPEGGFKNQETNSSQVTRKAYEEASFDEKQFNKYYDDDFIDGDLNNNTYIKIANVKTVLEKDYIDERQSKKSKTTIFEGMFAEVYSDKPVDSTVKISRNTIGTDKAEMDSSEFEKYFDVFSEDRILATRILTHDVMEIMTDFYSKLKYEVVIKNEKIYLRFFTSSMFEPNTFGNPLDKNLLYSYYYILKFILKLSDKLNTVIQDLD